VGVSGPAYDLYGGSHVVSTLPARLRECAATLATVDDAGAGRDPAYFRRLFAALLAALMDDGDGLMRDHDEIDAAAGAAGGRMLASSSSAAGRVGVVGGSWRRAAGPSGGTRAVRKKRLFTFSRRGGKDVLSGYASGGMLPGGDDPPPDVGKIAAGGRGRPSPGGTSNAEIVRRSGQQLELLSIVDDEMALPGYSRSAAGGGGGGRTPSSPSSPRRSKAGGGRAGGTTGGLSAPTARFGRTPAPSDLSGFEYRPPSSPRQHRHRRATASQGGGTSVSGTAASASTMGGPSDDVSVGTLGDDATAATVSSRYTTSSSSTSSSVPTLSKSKRDSSPIAASSKSSRSRFLQRKRTAKGEGGATPPQATTFKPPLFNPRQRPIPQPAYDPFGMDDDFDDYEADDTIAEIAGEVRSVSSVPSPTRDDQGAQTTPGDQTPMTPDYQSPTTPDERTPETPNAPEGDDTISQSSLSPPVTPQDYAYSSPMVQVMEATSRSMSEEEEEEEKSANVLQSIPEIAPSSPREEPQPTRDTDVGSAADEEEAEAERDVLEVALEPIRFLDIGLALNEDLTCEYHRSKLSSLSVDGTVQVSVKTRYEQEPSPRQRQQPTAPFSLIFTDHSGHIKALQENKKFVEHVTQGDIANREFAYTIRVPREDEYFPVVRYKCGTSLRPVPIVRPNRTSRPLKYSFFLSASTHTWRIDDSAFIRQTQRVQIRVKSQGKFCRIALQISSNPQNPSDLVNLTIIMSVPVEVRGDTMVCNPPGGVWNEAKRVVLWCISELGGGEKFQLQSVFELADESRNELEFPVLARCQCTGGQLSDVALEVSEISNAYPAPAEMSKSIARRFRVSHKESNK